MTGCESCGVGPEDDCSMDCLALVRGRLAVRSGALVEVDDRGRAQFLTCDWLIRVANGNPEPDSIEDCYDIVPCGSKVRVHPDYPGLADPLDATLCDGGHRRLTNHLEYAPYGPAWQDEQVERRDGEVTYR